MTQKEVEGAYERETGNVIVERFKNLSPLDVPGVLVQGHGPFAWGPSGAKAVEHALALENRRRDGDEDAADQPTGSTLAQYLVDKHFLRKHGTNAYYGQSK